MPLRRVSPPEFLPVSWEDANQQCRLDGDETQRELVESYIRAATDMLDGPNGYLGRAIANQTWEQECAGVPDAVRLGLMPVQDVTKVEVRDSAGQWQEVDAADYELHDAMDNPKVVLSSHSGDRVRVTFIAGYGEPPDVPAAIQQAILLLVGHWHAHRESVVVGAGVQLLPLSVEALLAPYRRVSFR